LFLSPTGPGAVVEDFCRFRKRPEREGGACVSFFLASKMHQSSFNAALPKAAAIS
jgi:hypothetical protein